VRNGCVKITKLGQCWFHCGARAPQWTRGSRPTGAHLPSSR
jgi:hypothetical protein